MNIVAVGQTVANLATKKAAEKDLRWWAKRIANAAIKGKTRVTRWSLRGLFVFNDRYNPPAAYFYQYAEVLQSLLGEKFFVQVQYGEKVQVSW